MTARPPSHQRSSQTPSKENSVTGLQGANRPTLGILAFLISASAAMIVFVLIPIEVLDRMHVLPGWGSGMFFVLALAPFVIAWDHYGGLMLCTITVCEVSRLALNAQQRRARIEAALAITLGVLAYLCIRLSVQFNIH